MQKMSNGESDAVAVFIARIFSARQPTVGYAERAMLSPARPIVRPSVCQTGGSV